MSTARENTARFDTRLPLEQKQLFEKASMLGGYRNLTDFIIAVAQKEANKIIEKNDMILASKRDKEIFFNALLNPAEPNKNLISANKDYNTLLNEWDIKQSH